MKNLFLKSSIYHNTLYVSTIIKDVDGFLFFIKRLYLNKIENHLLAWRPV
jgi:hypothetical protein